MVFVGDVVCLKQKCCKSGSVEADMLFVVVNVNNVTRRCVIRPLHSDLSIPGDELVGFDMIRKVSL